MKQKIKWIALALILTILIVITVVILNINSIVRSTVETQASASLSLHTTLKAADVSILGTSVKLTDLAIDSPPGFAAPKMIELGGLGLKVSLSELRQQPIRVSSITITKPHLVLEQKDMKLNLQAALALLPKSDPNAETIKLVIGEAKVEDAVVVIMPGLPGLDKEITINLPSLVVNNIGSGPDAQNGVIIKDAVLRIAEAMASAAADSDKLPPEVRALLKGDLSNLKDIANKGLESAKQEATKQIEKAKEQGTKQIEKGLGDLLKKK